MLAERYPVWEPLTISGMLDRVTKDHPGRPLVITNGATFSYADVQRESRRLASGLIACGLDMGGHVALDMANFPEFTLIKFAIARARGVCIPVNFLLRSRELSYVLGQSDSSILITMDAFRGHDYLADLAGIREDLPQLKQIFSLRTGEACTSQLPTLDELCAMATPESDAELARREAQADGTGLSDIIYTSGTTGRSKGVMLTHDMVLRAAYSSAVTRAFEDGRRIQFALPMYHVFAYVECLIASMFVGGAIIPHPVFDPSEMLEAAERHRASDIVCVPMMTSKLIELARTRGFDASHLLAIFNSGGVNAPSIWNDIRSILGAREIQTAYGMTETTASTTCTLPEGDDHYLLTTNGHLKLPCVAGDPTIGGMVAAYKVTDTETGMVLPPGTDGELIVKGPVVTKGYYNKPEETAAAFTPDGWLRTGDVGRLSADGYLTLTGRIKESYRCGGEMVMPREIEELFDDHDHIAQALVVGIPDAKMGEVGCLCIVPRSGNHPDPDALIALCAERLARFKVPRHVLMLDPEDIPQTPTGRPQRFKLAIEAARRIAAITPENGHSALL